MGTLQFDSLWKSESNCNVPIDSPMQEGMLLKHVSEPESHAYRLVDIFEVNGSLSEEMLRRAFDRLGRKHEVLRTAIIHDGVTILRQAIVDRKLGLRMIDLSTDVDAGEAGSKEADGIDAVMKIREDILQNGFDLQRKPLFSVTCVKAYEGRSYLITAVHHIIVDGWCINVLYRLGFKWPIVDDTYLEKVISAVESLEFFKNM